ACVGVDRLGGGRSLGGDAEGELRPVGQGPHRAGAADRDRTRARGRGGGAVGAVGPADTRQGDDEADDCDRGRETNEFHGLLPVSVAVTNTAPAGSPSPGPWGPGRGQAAAVAVAKGSR